MFSHGSSFFIYFFRQKAVIVFSQSESKVIFFVWGVVMCALAFICLFIYFSDVF